MAKKSKLFALKKRDSKCDMILRRSPYTKQYGSEGYVIGKVCRIDGGWEYSYVGPSPGTMHGPLKNKAAAMKAAISGWMTWVGVRHSEVKRGW